MKYMKFEYMKKKSYQNHYINLILVFCSANKDSNLLVFLHELFPVIKMYILFLIE